LHTIVRIIRLRGTLLGVVKEQQTAGRGLSRFPGSPGLTAGLPCVSGRTRVVNDRRCTLLMDGSRHTAAPGHCL